jgi:Domain of unknown function (DUF4124)
MAGLAAIGPAEARADVYRCTDEDGGIVFKQTPCAAEPSEPVMTGEAGEPGPDCGYANRFAFETGRLMRAGLRSDELFNRYGGIDALSRPAIGVINYVYSFRTNDDVSVERIADLAEAKCHAKSFGNVECDVLPAAFRDSIGGCSGEAGSTAPAEIPATPAPNSAPAPALQDARERAAAALGEEAVTECKQAYRDQLDAIDAEMRRGYSSEEGERYKERLLSLTERMRLCER